MKTSISPPSIPPFSSPEASAKKIHFLFLDGLRGVCALYVVLHHYLAWSSSGVSQRFSPLISWTSYGHFAVTIFIVLSGFSLMLQVASSPQGTLKGGIKSYFQRRAKRILPAYLAALLLSVVALIASTVWKDPVHSNWQNLPDLALGSLISHLFLLHNLNPAWALSINMAHWTIATEWQIYFFFPFILLPVWRRSQFLCIPAGIVIGLLPHFLLAHSNNLDEACPWFVALFCMGMMVATYCARSIPPLKSFVWLLGMALSAVTYFLLKKLFQGDDFAWTRDLCAGALVSCFIAWSTDALKRSTQRPPLPLRFLESRACVVLGSFSYSLYLTHCALLNLLNAATGKMGMTPDAALALRAFVGVPLALSLSYLFYLGFERPFIIRKAKV